jgi:uroporphyrinogen decarboxylase
MTGRERFIRALRREPPTGRVPHFELVFFLTMEVLGKVHPEHRSMHQWGQMSLTEKELQLQDVATCYIDIAVKYDHDAIFVIPAAHEEPAVRRLLEIIRERTGDQFFLLMHGDTTLAIPGGATMEDFAIRLYEDRASLRDEMRRNIDHQMGLAGRLSGTGLLDGYGLCSDYCFNQTPFFTPDIFADLIAPALKETIDGYRELGFYSIKHTDGNIMPIVDQLVAAGPDALHSLDPQGGVDLAEIKRLYGDQVCLIGNVNCGLLQSGSEAEVVADTRRALRDGMPGGGYIFSTSNCVYTGLPLERYELMHSIWRDEGHYPA